MNQFADQAMPTVAEVDAQITEAERLLAANRAEAQHVLDELADRDDPEKLDRLAKLDVQRQVFERRIQMLHQQHQHSAAHEAVDRMRADADALQRKAATLRELEHGDETRELLRRLKEIQQQADAVRGELSLSVTTFRDRHPIDATTRALVGTEVDALQARVGKIVDQLYPVTTQHL